MSWSYLDNCHTLHPGIVFCKSFQHMTPLSLLSPETVLVESLQKPYHIPNTQSNEPALCTVLYLLSHAGSC